MAWLKAIRSHFLDGDVQAVGAVYEAPDKLALELVHTGKALRASAPEPPAKPTSRKSVKKEEISNAQL